MSTLDNINENIIIKINIIKKISSYLLSDFNLCNLYDSSDGIIKRNINILKSKYNDVLDKISLYEINSILFLTEYYKIFNNIDIIDEYNENKRNIYNDSIFLLSDNNLLLNNNDLLELKDIYYSNYYNYKKFKYIFKKATSNLDNKQKTKYIYKNFNMFLSINDIYGTFDNFIDYVESFLTIYKDLLQDRLESNNIDSVKIYKDILISINQFKKTKLLYNINELSYDICDCGTKMTIQTNTSELLCVKCGYINTLVGSVYEDSMFFMQVENRYQHGKYDPSRHCKFWIERIQAKENTVIDKSVIEKIENCIKKDKIKNTKNISVKQFRMYLKQTKLSKLNDHIPLIKKIISGYIPPQLDHKELHLLFNYFDKATKTYEVIKPKEKKNSLYYPFLIYKILDLIIDDEEKKNGLLSCIHLQSYETLIDNDKIWKSICEHNDNFVYKPTNKHDLY